jgi:hypothetical protein
MLMSLRTTSKRVLSCMSAVCCEAGMPEVLLHNNVS